MRLAAPGAAASMALVCLGITNELTATLMLAPNGTRTLATAFWSLTSEIDYAAAAPYALIMVLFSLPLTLLLYVQSTSESPGDERFRRSRASRKRYGARRRARRRRPRAWRPAAAPPSSGRPARARRRCCASSPASSRRTRPHHARRRTMLADGALAVPAHRRGIGFVAQDGALFPHLSVADNIGFGLDRGRCRPGRAHRGACRDGRARHGDAAAPARTSCPAASSSAWRWPAPWRAGPG